jgi:hypothetical protein
MLVRVQKSGKLKLWPATIKNTYFAALSPSQATRPSFLGLKACQFSTQERRGVDAYLE